MYTTKAAAEGVPDRGVNLIVMMWFLTVVSSVTIVMRLVFRARKATTGWDDCFMLLAMVRSFVNFVEAQHLANCGSYASMAGLSPSPVSVLEAEKDTYRISGSWVQTL